MLNIIEDEGRFADVGEVVALKLESLKPVFFDVDKFKYDVELSFDIDDAGCISDEDEITFVKYLGNGLFLYTGNLPF